MSARRADPVRRPPRDAARPGCCATFNDAGVLDAADVHVALRLARARAATTTSTVALAAALAVRGPRLGHVYVDLATIRETATVDADEPVDLSALPWPDRRRVDRAARGEPRSSPSARTARRAGRCASSAPRSTSTATGARSARSPPTCRRSAPRAPDDVDDDVLADGLARLFAGDDRRAPALRRAPPRCCAASPSSPAARAPARRRPSPGSSRCSPSRPRPPARRRRSIALAAPTGKAAARLRGGGPRGGRRARRRATPSARSCSALQRLDAAPAARLAARTATAASATTAATGCRTTS